MDLADLFIGTVPMGNPDTYNAGSPAAPQTFSAPQASTQVAYANPEPGTNPLPAASLKPVMWLVLLVSGLVVIRILHDMAGEED